MGGCRCGALVLHALARRLEFVGHIGDPTARPDQRPLLALLQHRLLLDFEVFGKPLGVRGSALEHGCDRPPYIFAALPGVAALR